MREVEAEQVRRKRRRIVTATAKGGSWKSEGQLILILESDRLFMVY